MKTWLKIIIGIIIIGIVAASAVYVFVINKPKRDIENEKSMYSVTAGQIFKEYTTNATASNMLYLDKTGTIKGTITSIEHIDSLVIVVFTLSEGMFGEEGVRCTMLEKYNTEALALNTGIIVEIKGVCRGYNGSDIIFEKCSFN